MDEVLVVEPDTRAAELFARRGSRMVLVESSPLRVTALGIELSVEEGPRLRLTWEGGRAEA